MIQELPVGPRIGVRNFEINVRREQINEEGILEEFKKGKRRIRAIVQQEKRVNRELE